MITPINNANSQNFTGKFKMSGPWSRISKEYLKEFMHTGINGQTNKQFIKKKSYDIYAIANNKDHNIELRSEFETPSNTRIYLLSVLHPKDNVKEQDFDTFRKAITEFEKDKAIFKGYNNILEKVTINIKNLFKKS